MRRFITNLQPAQACTFDQREYCAFGMPEVSEATCQSSAVPVKTKQDWDDDRMPVRPVRCWKRHRGHQWRKDEVSAKSMMDDLVGVALGL